MVKLLRRALLGNMPFFHDDNLIGDRQGFFLIVGHIDRREAEALLQIADLGADAATQPLVEVG
ncbi:hypothetical protein D3C80_1362320 [compost metagenome]